MTLLIRLTIIALSMAACADCATGHPKLASGSVVAGNLEGVVSLMGERSMAQACPIAPDLALTNGHVVKDQSWLDGSVSIAPYIWEGSGQTGIVGAPGTTRWDTFRDLAYVTPYKGTFPRWYQIAKDAPKPGDHLRFIGWDFRKRRDAFAPRTFDATVIRVRNGHVIFYPPGVPGTSGSCVLNDRGEVVAVQAFGQPLEDKTTVDGAVGVWGDLLALGTP